MPVRCTRLLKREHPGARHLTTLMCAKHRSQVLAEVRLLLKAGKPCRLVATSLIEAGVDVDFPAVLRAEAGLDSIAQAAGRCNREGKRAPADSAVMIFATENLDWRRHRNSNSSPKPRARYCACMAMIHWDWAPSNVISVCCIGKKARRNWMPTIC